MFAGKLILLSGKFLQENNVREGDTNSSVIWWKYPKKSYSLLQQLNNSEKSNSDYNKYKTNAITSDQTNKTYI